MLSGRLKAKIAQGTTFAFVRISALPRTCIQSVSVELFSMPCSLVSQGERDAIILCRPWTISASTLPYSIEHFLNSITLCDANKITENKYICLCSSKRVYQRSPMLLEVKERVTLLHLHSTEIFLFYPGDPNNLLYMPLLATVRRYH